MKQLRAAVVGAGGPSSLTQAYYLLRAGYETTLHFSEEVDHDPSRAVSAIIDPAHIPLTNLDELSKVLQIGFIHYLGAMEDTKSGVRPTLHRILNENPFEPPWYLSAIQTLLRSSEVGAMLIGRDEPMFKPDKVGEARNIPEAFRDRFPHGFQFPTWDMDPTAYLNWLKRRCIALGLEISKKMVTNQDELDKLNADVVIVCPGTRWVHEKLPPADDMISVVMTSDYKIGRPGHSFRHHDSKLSIVPVDDGVVVGHTAPSVDDDTAERDMVKLVKDLIPGIELDRDHSRIGHWRARKSGVQIIIDDPDNGATRLVMTHSGFGGDSYTLSPGYAAEAVSMANGYLRN